MKTIVCKNCGGKYDDTLSKCPYCGTMNKKGAYRDFRFKISDIIENVLGLKEEAYDSVHKLIFSALIRGTLLVTIIGGLGFLLGYNSNVNYYNDREYDEKTYENIIWEEENLEKLEEAYRNNDLETIDKLYYENSRVISNWEHFASFSLKKAYQNIKEDTYFTSYSLSRMLYFIYYPDYYGNTNKMSAEEIEEYETEKSDVINMLKEKGYSEEELKNIYDSCKDGYGYISSGDVEKLMKEENNG